MEIKFAKGSFSEFEGTQEELDQLIKEITDMAESGQLLEQSVEVDLDDLEITDPRLYDAIMNAYDAMLEEENTNTYRNKLN